MQVQACQREGAPRAPSAPPSALAPGAPSLPAGPSARDLPAERFRVGAGEGVQGSEQGLSSAASDVRTFAGLDRERGWIAA